jgi:4-amino-4-deoxy-L-arabinose transferase-like glycosyltransferase
VPALVSGPEPLLQDARGDAAAEELSLEVEVRGEVGVRAQNVREAAALGVDDDQGDKRQEVEQVAPPAPQHEGWNEQQQRIAIRRPAEVENADRQSEEEAEDSRRKRDRTRFRLRAPYAPAFAAVIAALLALGTRAAFWDAPLTADEGGYAQIARLWDRGAALYGGVWVDRPQGLLLVYRALLDLGGGSTESLRIFAAVVAMVVVVATVAVALRICGTMEAIAAGLLLATFGASPFIESFTLAGELLAAFPAVLSLLAFTAYLRGRRMLWLVVAGLLTGCAVMIKQSAFDAGLAAFVFLLMTERRRARSASVLVLAALVPVVLAASTAPHLEDWWHAVVAYRTEGDSLLTGSPLHRVELLADSLPAAAKGLGLLALLAAIGWRSSPLIARLWLGAALVGVLGGGNFHPHYYVQLAAPLSILAAVGVRQLLVERRRVAMAACGVAAVTTLALTVPLWFASGSAQARAIWPKDRRLIQSDAIAAYVQVHTRPNERIYVLWAGADVYYLADRRPMLRYMWFRNVERIDGAVASARRLLAAQRPALVVLAQRPASIDPTGVTARILRQRYRLQARVAGVPILERRRAPRPPRRLMAVRPPHLPQLPG